MLWARMSLRRTDARPALFGAVAYGVLRTRRSHRGGWLSYPWSHRHLRQSSGRNFEVDVRAGLTASPKALASKWLYNPAGCDLFEQITMLEEYYPTRAERSILVARSEEIGGAVSSNDAYRTGLGDIREDAPLAEGV